MSLRPSVNRERILAFLTALGRRFAKPARVYLVGGATLILEKIRETTVDIDLNFEVASADTVEFVDAIRALKDELQINVEEVSPADFIPLPDGWRERCSFVGQYGSVEVFHFDLYSMSLSKIERGWDSDFKDVLLLLKAGRVEFHELEKHFNAILPRFGKESLKRDPKKFARNFKHLKTRHSMREL